MGKKAKTSSGKIKARERKIDKASLPPPPPPLVEEVSRSSLQSLDMGYFFPRMKKQIDLLHLKILRLFLFGSLQLNFALVAWICKIVRSTCSPREQ
jgi:hypothetical protein